MFEVVGIALCAVSILAFGLAGLTSPKSTEVVRVTCAYVVAAVLLAGAIMGPMVATSIIELLK